MRFAHPGLLLLIPVLIAMIGGVWVLEKRRNRRRIAQVSGIVASSSAFKIIGVNP
jgi:mannitol-specific phosphotransferase system IIBC component